MSLSYGERLEAAFADYGHVCMGIDPHLSELQAWGLEDNAAGLREFAMRILEAAQGRVAAVKPQSAFFERHGWQGIKVLSEVLQSARELGILTILDVKRGDIGSTMAGYAQAYLGDNAPLRADAITISPYLGFGSLQPAIDLAQATNSGLYILTLTSNPEGKQVQHAVNSVEKSVAKVMVEAVSKENSVLCSENHIGNLGLVIGATLKQALQELDISLAGSKASILAPGIGAQGARPADLPEVFGESAKNVLASASRSLTQHGPDIKTMMQEIDILRTELERELK